MKESTESSKQNNQSNSGQESSSKKDDFNWKKPHLFAVSMLISFIIGAAVIGCIAYILIKNLNKRRGRVSKIETPPSLIVSEPNHYYQRNTYEEYRYESLRMNALELLDWERINSFYQTSNN